MPRLARLDAAGALHHVMIRGIERRKIFRDNRDRDDLLERLSTILPETNTSHHVTHGHSCQTTPTFSSGAVNQEYQRS